MRIGAIEIHGESVYLSGFGAEAHTHKAKFIFIIFKKCIESVNIAISIEDLQALVFLLLCVVIEIRRHLLVF